MNLYDNKFSLTCDKTFADFEKALIGIAQNEPVLMSQVRALLSKEGFDWVGSQTEGIKKTQLLDVRYDNRYPTPVDFLVLKSRKDDVEYLCKNHRFDLGVRQAEDRVSRNTMSVKPEISILSRVWRIILLVLTFGHSAKNRHVNHVVWNRMLRILKEDKTLTPCIEYRDERETFTASAFLNGDESAMVVRRQGTYITVERREVKTLRLVKIPKIEVSFPQKVSRPVFQRGGSGRIENWNSIKKCGIVSGEKTAEKFWFSANMILDERLLRSLDSGKYGQIVRYSVVRESVGKGQFPVVQILEMTKDYYVEFDPRYKAGHEAMIKGDLDLAVSSLALVVRDENSKSRLSAIKDLAEVYNRQDLPQKALELIESVRHDFPSTDEQTSFDMMEINYLEGLSRWDEARDKVQALLNCDMPENRRAHFMRKLSRLKNLVSREVELGLDLRDEGSSLMAKRIKDTGIVVKTVEELINKYVYGIVENNGEYQTVKIIMRKLNDYLSAKTWVEKESIVDFIVTGMEGIVALPRVVSAAIIDALQKDLLRTIRNGATIEIEGRGFVINSETSSATLRLDISLPDPSSIPLKNIRIILDENHESEPKSLDGLTFDDGRVSVERSFRLLKEEAASRHVSVVVRMSYDLDVKEDVIDSLDDELTHGVAEKRLSFDFDKNDKKAPNRIYPNPFADYCNHVATGNYFVGREELMDEICSVVASPSEATGQAFVLYGQARSGKSSIRENLSNKLRTIGDGRIFYTEVSVHKWTENMLSGKQPLQFLVYDLFVSARNKLKELKVWTEEVKAEYAEIPSEYYAKKIEFLGDKLRDTGFLWVVAIDEFTDLYDILVTSAKDDDVERRILDILRALKGVLEARPPAFNLLLIGQDSMPLFKDRFWNKFSVSKERRISYLEKIPTKQLLQMPIESESGIEISADALDLYYDYVGGYPLYTMYFCARVVDYINAALEPLNAINVEDIEKVAKSFCKGDGKLRPTEFDPFVQLELPELDGEDLMAIYYALAKHDSHFDGLFPDVSVEVRQRRSKLFKELVNRHVIQEKTDGMGRLRMGLFAKYLQENPGLTIEDLRSAKGWYHD